MRTLLKKLFAIPAPKPLLATNLQARAYAQYRTEVFLSIFIGYAGYYLVRKNLALTAPHLIEHYQYDMRQIGLMMGAISFSYGISKFVMGALSDRSNAKVFLSFGLLFSALISLAIGFAPDYFFGNFSVLFVMMLINGWVQGMGWPPCGRAMVHWFSQKERCSKMAIWNMAHNIGQALPALLISFGMTLYFGWTSIIWIPGLMALAISIFVYNKMQDTPQSVGLPTVEKFQDANSQESQNIKKLTSADFRRYVLGNKYLWALAMANLFVYLTRYAVIDWLPLYLVSVRGYTEQKASLCYSMYELAGIGGTFVCGWMSDHIFNGKRAPAGILFLVVVSIILSIYWYLPIEYVKTTDLCLFSLGFLIYGPVMIIGLHAIDIVPKHVAGTAAGFTGLFGYVGGTTCANAAFGYIVHYYGWDAGFLLLLASCCLSVFFLSLTWNTLCVSSEKSSIALSPAVLSSNSSSAT